MTENQHPLTETAAVEMWDAAADWNTEATLDDLTAGCRIAMIGMARAAFDAGREHERATPADPRHDPRPWDLLAPDDPLNEGDEVWREWRGVSTRGIVGVQHSDLQVYTAERGNLGHRANGTWCVRRIPAPPAVEVEMPTEHPAHITDVKDVNGDVCAHMALSNDGSWVGVDQNGNPRIRQPRGLTAFTLPDGTRARRDGEHEDGTPRFVECGEGEK